MALLFMDSFDHYATADITEKWTAVGVLESSGFATAPAIGAYGRNATSGLRTSMGAPNSVGLPMCVTVAPSDNVCLVGFAFKPSSFAAIAVGPSSAAAFWNANWVLSVRMNNSQLWYARLNQDGTISIFRDVSGTGTLLGTTSLALQAGVWTYLEFRVTVHDSTGTVDVRFNGTPAMTGLTGQNTRGTGAVNTWNAVRVGYVNAETTPITFDFDDLVVMDASGSYNNAFIGDVTISILNPNGAGNSTDWTPSAGSNYQCVDEDLVNDDTDYVSSSTLNAKDLYAMEDCAAGADIRAVQVVTAMRKGTEGPGKIKHVIRSNSTDYDSAEMGLGGTAYSFNRTIWETDPATAAAWTESGWNAAEVGVKKTG